MVNGYRYVAPLDRKSRQELELLHHKRMNLQPLRGDKRIIIGDLSQTGAGKTRACIKAIVEHVWAERAAGFRVWVVVIASHILLVKSLWEEIKKAFDEEGLPEPMQYNNDELSKDNFLSPPPSPPPPPPSPNPPSPPRPPAPPAVYYSNAASEFTCPNVYLALSIGESYIPAPPRPTLRCEQTRC